ncbi:MAG TPA: hypothetical protein VEC06_10340 [Paucimonas sp.]|nr:hypothetical protein [Paucimonas sp.]
MDLMRQGARAFREWKQARKDRNTIDKLRNDPSTFLRSHTLNTAWPEAPGSAANQSQQARQFYLVEEHNPNPATRPGRILGDLRPHTVKNYRLATDQETAAALGRVVGSFQAPHLAVRQAHADDAPNLPALQPSSLDLRQVGRGSTVHTMDLSGCTIKREQHSLFHVQPQAVGADLHHTLGNHTFGPNDYGAQNTSIMFRQKRKGLKYYAQTTDAAGRPQLRKGYL